MFDEDGSYEAEYFRKAYMEPDNKFFEVGTPAGHTDPMTYDEAMELMEQAPHATLEAWNGHEWEILFDGQLEFIGVQP